MRLASRHLQPYAHRYSPRKFTQPQLFACLTLRIFFKTDYRGIACFLADMPSICRLIGLRTVPHYTTLQKASQRFLTDRKLQELLAATVMKLRKNVPLAALDSTGMESGHVSPYYYTVREKRAKNLKCRRFTRYPKLSIVVDVVTHIILAAYPSRGPGSDCSEFKDVLALVPPELKLQHLLADAGYDSEANHVHAREVLGIMASIPPTKGRKTENLPVSRYRREMASDFDRQNYRQRWQVETVMSMIKRCLGYTIRARQESSQRTEMLLMATTFNIMVFFLLVKELFYRAQI
jgi:hypothetical protein